MRIGKTFAGTVVLGASLALASPAAAAPAADDFLNPQMAGPRLTLMPIIGPGFRAIYDHRFQIEKDMSEVRTQLMGTIALPFSEVSANIDARFFLMTFGASVGYHNEWHVLQFQPDPQTGWDRADQPRVEIQPTIPGLGTDPNVGFPDLNADARAMKDQNADTQTGAWPWYEARWGFLWPGYNFMGASTFALRHDGRPDVSYDWEGATVYNSGMHLRWEGYAFLRDRNTGFIGPALRAFYVPRNRIRDDVNTPAGTVLEAGSSCQPNVVPNQVCVETYEFEFHYGFVAGIRPNWVKSSDLFVIRSYATWGLGNPLFGTHFFRQPLQILVAYMVDFNL